MTSFKPLHIQRTFSAPRQAVWDAWTQPEQFKQWYMPAPYTVPFCDFDLRPGGKLHIDTKSPEGDIMPVIGEYVTVEEPSKLVLTNALLDADGNTLFNVRQTVTLTEKDNQTVLDITAEVLSAADGADQFLAGMEPGFQQAFDQLSQLVNH
jgi:uncharacterized protein YndB with AHSA1/START domain